MILKEMNPSDFAGVKENPWFECIDGWVALFCICLVGISAFWFHDWMEREFQNRLQAEVASLEALHRLEHENLLNELLTLINEPADYNGNNGDLNNNEIGTRDRNLAD